MKFAHLVKSATAAFILSASLATAQIPAEFANDPIVLRLAEQLATQGFEIIGVKITFLGRYKIEAVAQGYEREIVVSAGAGTILRDRWTETGDSNGTSTEAIEGSGKDSNGTDGGDGADGGTDGADSGASDDSSTDIIEEGSDSGENGDSDPEGSDAEIEGA